MANVKTGWLEDNTGEKFAPKTYPSQVIMRDGKSLEDSDIAYIDETDSDFIDDVVEEENTDSNATSNTVLVPVEASGFVLNESTGRYEQTVSVVGMTEGNGGIWDIVRSGSVLTEEEAEIVANITDVERLENGVKISCIEVPTQTYTLVLYGTFVNSGETLVSSMPAWFNRVEAVENKVEELNSKIVYIDYLFDNIGFTAGSIGTRGAQYEWNIQEYINQGFLCIGGFVTYISSSGDMQPNVFMSGANVYLNIYRATSAAISGGKIYIRIILIKN